METIKIRALTEDDIPAVLDLLESVAAEERWIGTELPIDRADRTKRWRTDYLGDRGCMFVAEVDGALVGTSGVEDDRGLVDLGMMVRDGYRRQGIGSQLLQASIDWARARGAHKITLQSWPENQPAIALYERFGFEREGHLRGHYKRRNGEIWDAVIMGLRLNET
ncbi:MAG TPA: GNAT family N-acetyltransferase [Actinomycetota bacterium]|nr:GNAT family N-acetyltransferase [Actinomycetota bacterium]